MIEHQYSHDFYDYIDAGSRRSARAVAGLLLPEMKIKSLLDIGAGHGAWAAEWLAAGVKDVLAVDGDYVQPGPARRSRQPISAPTISPRRSTSIAASTWSRRWKWPSICRTPRPICSSTISSPTAT